MYKRQTHLGALALEVGAQTVDDLLADFLGHVVAEHLADAYHMLGSPGLLFGLQGELLTGNMAHRALSGGNITFMTVSYTHLDVYKRQLVSTTVVEVGVDVPNATLMVVENAERFGLSQLHQLRGRVGRGKAKSYCVLVSQGGGEETKRRLKALTDTNDGFKIAEEDLKLRGPGDFFGQRQHGLPMLQIADLNCDMLLLSEAQTAAREAQVCLLYTSRCV